LGIAALNPTRFWVRSTLIAAEVEVCVHIVHWRY